MLKFFRIFFSGTNVLYDTNDTDTGKAIFKLACGQLMKKLHTLLSRKFLVAIRIRKTLEELSAVIASINWENFIL